MYNSFNVIHFLNKISSIVIIFASNNENFKFKFVFKFAIEYP